MGIILWPAALLLFLFWTLAAWLVFGLSEWTASQVSGAVGGVLTAELGPWAAWIIGSLGTIIKFGVVAVWAIISLAILAAPLWLRRQRRAGRIPDSYTQGYRRRNKPYEAQTSEYSNADDGFEYEPRRQGNREKPWRDRKEWQKRAQQGYGEISFLRDSVGEMMGKHRRRKKKKRYDDDD